MAEAARLVLVCDTSSLAQGESALDSLARTGGKVEGNLTINAKGIEKAMARIATVMGGLDTTMVSLERAVSQSMGRTSQEVTRSARTFEDLRRQIDPTYAASQRFAEVQGDLARMVIDGSASQKQANAVLEIARSRYLGVATAAEAAEQAQREQAAAVTQATAGYEALRMSLDPVYASSKRYEAAQETLTAAVRQGIITQAEMNRTLSMASTQFLAPTSGLRGVAGAAGNAGKGLAKFGPALTNVGFQIQDFAVQVASGQSAMIAFTQQFPQLAGALGFSGKLALIGSGIGTLVAVGMAVAPVLFDIGKKAKTAEEAIDDLADAFGRYRQYASDAAKSNAELMAEFGSLSGEARRVSEALAQITRLEAIEAIDVAMAKLTGTFGNLSKTMAAEAGPARWMLDAGITISQFEKTVQNMSSAMEITEAQALKVAEALAQVGDAPLGQQTKAAADFNAQMIAVFGSVEAIPPQLREILKQTLRLGNETAVVAGNIGSIEDLAASLQGTFTSLGNSLGFAIDNTNSWAMAMAGVRSEIYGIASALSQIGGGMISNAAKFVEINALKAGRSVAEARVEMEQFNIAAGYDGRIMAAEARGGILGWTEAQALKAAKGLEMAGLAATTEADALRRSAAEAERAAASTGSAGAEAKKAAKEIDKLNDNLDKEAQNWRETLDPMAKYRREAAELAKLTGRLSKNEMAQAQRNLNIQLADSLPLAGKFTDIMTDGLLSGFKGTLSSIGDMLKAWLAQMMAMAAKNRIMISMGLGGIPGGGGALSSALGAAGAPVGGLTGAGGVLGGIASLGTAAMSAFTGGLQAAMGGIGSITQYTSLMMGGATTSLAGFASAAGAIAVPLLAVAAVFSFFKKKTKELDNGLRITVDGFETAADTFRKTETRRFWGLSKKTRTSYDRADRETQDALSSIVGKIQTGVMDAATALGFGAETFAGFAHQMTISTKGMSKEDAQRAVEEALAGLGDGFAGMIPGLKALRKDGESTTEALSRLSTALTGVNGIMDTLGHDFYAVGLSGANAASKIAEAFGGLDAMASATQRFYSAFYTEQERLEVTTRQTTEALARLGITMPRTRDQYRAMVSSLDLTTAAGRKAYAALIGMADAFDLILPKIGALTEAMAAAQDAVRTGLDGAIGAAQEAAKANATAAGNWYKAAGSIREYIDKLRGTASALFNPAQALRYNRRQYNQTYQRALGGDLAAAQNVTGAADRYLSSVMDTARTREEAALAQARVLSQMGLLQGVADIEGARHDVIAGLIGQQVELLTDARDFLAAGGVMTAEMITTLRTGLGSINGAITAAQQISWAALQRRLNVTVDVIADADIPAHVRTLLANAANGVRGFVDFVVRSDLTPDQKWLALTNSSAHLTTVNFLAQNRMSPEYTRLALQAGSNYRVAVTTQIQSGSVLNAAQLQRLFTGSADGRITLGGSFRFDPSAGFATWYETASRAAIQQPMTALRTAMGTLQAALTALRAAIIAPPPVTSTPAPRPVTPTTPTGSTRPTAPARLSLSDYRFRERVQNSSGGQEYYTTITGPNGGTRRISGRTMQAQSWLVNSNFPRFERGGQHGGGFRIVGEKGPELEATGPSRIFSNSQSRSMLDNSEVVRELRAVRAELAEMQAHARRTAESTRDTFKTLREINSVGVKIDPDQNKVSA